MRERIEPLAGMVLKGVIRAYQYLISPVLAGNCRFHPTCSAYAVDAIDEHGALKGIWMASVRIVRCNPWGGSGFDPVPRADSKSVELCDHAPKTVSGGPAGL